MFNRNVNWDLAWWEYRGSALWLVKLVLQLQANILWTFYWKGKLSRHLEKPWKIASWEPLLLILWGQMPLLLKRKIAIFLDPVLCSHRSAYQQYQILIQGCLVFRLSNYFVQLLITPLWVSTSDYTLVSSMVPCSKLDHISTRPKFLS